MSKPSYLVWRRDSPSSCVLAQGRTASKDTSSSLTRRPSPARPRHPWQLSMSSSKHTSPSVSTTRNPFSTSIHSSKPQFLTLMWEVPRKVPESRSYEQGFCTTLEVINILGCKYVSFFMFPQKFCIALPAFKTTPRSISWQDITFKMWTARMLFIILHLFRFQEASCSFP